MARGRRHDPRSLPDGLTTACRGVTLFRLDPNLSHLFLCDRIPRPRRVSSLLFSSLTSFLEIFSPRLRVIQGQAGLASGFRLPPPSRSRSPRLRVSRSIFFPSDPLSQGRGASCVVNQPFFLSDILSPGNFRRFVRSLRRFFSIFRRAEAPPDISSSISSVREPDVVPDYEFFFSTDLGRLYSIFAFGGWKCALAAEEFDRQVVFFFLSLFFF